MHFEVKDQMAGPNDMHCPLYCVPYNAEGITRKEEGSNRISLVSLTLLSSPNSICMLLSTGERGEKNDSWVDKYVGRDRKSVV